MQTTCILRGMLANLLNYSVAEIDWKSLAATPNNHCTPCTPTQVGVQVHCPLTLFVHLKRIIWSCYLWSPKEKKKQTQISPSGRPPAEQWASPGACALGPTRPDLSWDVWTQEELTLLLGGAQNFTFSRPGPGPSEKVWNLLFKPLENFLSFSIWRLKGWRVGMGVCSHWGWEYWSSLFHSLHCHKELCLPINLVSSKEIMSSRWLEDGRSKAICHQLSV